ncbi:MAG: aminotransferase class I/II-fold pyridoxal phosphate-dependent enzyme [Brachybacterium sp.]|nr:aminotransferase class I/II-fold pyridoxal phosphate-dependent enzyme [Brachybacterium sp.]
MTAPPSSPPRLDGPWQDAARGANLLRSATADPSAVQPSIFARMSALATRLGAMNLGQGFPDDDPPEVVARTAAEAILAGRNQYPPGPGTPELREAVAAHQARWYGMDVDPDAEVLVTTGASEALSASLLAFIRPGDEVLTLEPFFDLYGGVIGLAGGVHRTVPLASSIGEDGDLVLGVDPAAIRAAITERTRVILLNTPHNPTGLVLGEDVLRAVVEGARTHDALIITDEVYEHLLFDGARHRPIATLPGAWERTITIGSAGKTFSVTGWKIGWVTAPKELVTAVTAVKQWLTYVSGAPFQPAIAAGLALPEDAFSAIAADLQRRRDGLLEVLRRTGFRVSVPRAGYFVVADAAPLGETDGEDLCERLAHEAGVVAIPCSAFYRGDPGEARSHVRFAFCKADAVMDEAAQRLERWAS